MGSYIQHLQTAGFFGIACFMVLTFVVELDIWYAILGLYLCTFGGMLPDLDSDSGKPVREIFALAAVLGAVGTVMMLDGENNIKITVVAMTVFIIVKWPIQILFKKVTKHRGMWHSIPMGINYSLMILIAYQNYWLMGCALAGWISHLLLDEWFARDNQFKGTSMKFKSKYKDTTILTYVVLFILASYVGIVEMVI